MKKTTKTELSLTEIFAEHCKMILEDTAAASANGKKKAARRIMAVGKAIIELYAGIYEISFEKADDFLYIAVCGGDNGTGKSPIEAGFNPEKPAEGILEKFSDCLNNANGRKYETDIAAEVVTVYAEWQRISFATAVNRLRTDNRQEVKV